MSEDESEGKLSSKFRAGLSRIKAGAQRVGAEAKEQVSNPESATRKVTSGVKAGGQAIASGVNRAAKNEYVQRVSANSVKMVKGEDDGLLSVHREQKQRASNSHMDGLFSSGAIGAGFAIYGSGSKRSQQYSGGFSIMGEGAHNKPTHTKHRNKGHTTVVVTKTVYTNQGRKKKRKQQQPEWTLF